MKRQVQRIKDICRSRGFNFSKLVITENSAFVELILVKESAYKGQFKQLAFVGTGGVTLENYNGEINGEKFIDLSKVYCEISPLLKEMI